MSATIDAASVMKLRQITDAGVMDCKKALQEADGDLDKAVSLLREWGAAKAQKKAERAAKEGRVECYLHFDGKQAALVELNCETDFVARNSEFVQLARGIAMHVVAKKPTYVSKEDVPAEVVEQEKQIYRSQALAEGKPERVVGRIAEGRLAKFYEDSCLLEQPFIRDDERTVGQLIQEQIAKVGENIVVGRFVRFKVGEA